MTTTADCRIFLESSPEVAAQNPGPWKRISKKNAPDGIERVFASTDGQCFVRLTEDKAGNLDVTHIAATLQDLTLPSSVVARPPAPAAAPSPTCPQTGRAFEPTFPPFAPSQSDLHTVELDQNAIAQVRGVLMGWFSDVHDELMYEDVAEFAETYPIAMANEYCFAVSLDANQDVFVEVAPRDYWNAAHLVADRLSPLECVLPGTDPESPNDSSTWLLHGINGNPHDVAVAMLGAGFAWDPDYQNTIDAAMQVPAQVGHAFAQWMAGHQLPALLTASRQSSFLGQFIGMMNPATSVGDLDTLIARAGRESGQFMPDRPGPPLAYAMVIIPDPAVISPANQSILQEVLALAGPLSSSGLQLVPVLDSSPAAAELAARLGVPLPAWEVVGLRGKDMEVASDPSTHVGQVLSPLREGLAQKAAYVKPSGPKI